MKLDDELLEAAASGQTEKVLELLKMGADLHALDIFCYCQFTGFKEGGIQCRVVSSTLPPSPHDSPGKDIFSVGTDATLRLAASNGHTTTVKLLLDQGSGACAAGYLGRGAPLRLASENGHIAIV